MILFINGAFGVGKTTTAQRLQETVRNSILFDPELVGAMVQRVTEGVREGDETTDDFQDIRMWRAMTIETARQLRHHYGKNLIVPMTIQSEAYFHEVLDGLRGIDPEVYHFCLTAPVEVIRKRLLERGDEEGSWPWQRVRSCVEAFRSPLFAEHIETEARSPSATASHILARLDRKTACKRG